MKTFYYTTFLFFFISINAIKGQSNYYSKFIYPSLEIGVNYPILNSFDAYRSLRRPHDGNYNTNLFKVGNIVEFELPLIESNRVYLSSTLGILNLQVGKITNVRTVIHENRKRPWNPYLKLNGGLKLFRFSNFALALQGHAGWAFAKYPTLQVNTLYWDNPLKTTEPVTFLEVSFAPNMSINTGASVVLKYWVNQRLQLGFNARYSIWWINQQQTSTTYRGGLPETQERRLEEFISIPSISVSIGYALFDK